MCRTEGDDGAAGEEEVGGEGSADALGGLPGEEERAKEAEEVSKKSGENSDTVRRYTQVNAARCSHVHNLSPASFSTISHTRLIKHIY